MPPKKRNNRRDTVKRATKKRLMEISVLVDNYIYKNKTITLEEAKNYVNEISLYRVKCRNDKHILQVIEKLTNCMKRIIKEKVEKVSPSIKNPEGSKEESINLLNESPVINKTQDDGNLQAIRSKSKTEKYLGTSSPEIVIVISDCEDTESDSKNTSKQPIYNEGLNKLHFNCSKIIDVNKDSVPAQNTEVNNMSDIITHHTILSKQNLISNTVNTLFGIKNNYTVKNVCTTKQINAVNDNSIDVNNEKNKGQKKKVVNSIENTQLITDAPLQNTKTKNKATVTRKHGRKINKNESKTINTSDFKKVKRTPNNPKTSKKDTVPNKKKKADNIVLKALIDNNTTPTFFTPSCPISNKYNQNVDFNSDKVPLFITDDAMVKPANQDQISKQMDGLKIHCDQNNLTWIEGIRYVREVTNEEFEQSPKKYHASFWSNFELPNDWNDVEFLD